MTAPTLTTQRLTLRALGRATLRQIDWLNDPEIVRYSEQRHCVHTINTQKKYIEHFPGFLWAIEHVATDQHIGNLSATVDKHNGVADVGMLLGSEFWKHGFGTEAWQAATNWLLEVDGGKFRKLEAGCAAVNLGMKRILTKTGFTFEGERKNHLIIDHAPCGALFYGRFK